MPSEGAIGARCHAGQVTQVLENNEKAPHLNELVRDGRANPFFSFRPKEPKRREIRPAH